MTPSSPSISHLLYANDAHLHIIHLYSTNENGSSSHLFTSLYNASSCVASFVSQGHPLGVGIVISVSQLRKLRSREGRELPKDPHRGRGGGGMQIWSLAPEHTLCVKAFCSSAHRGLRLCPSADAGCWPPQCPAIHHPL